MIKKIAHVVLLFSLLFACAKKPPGHYKIETSTDTDRVSLKKKSFIKSTVFKESFNELGDYDSLEYFLLAPNNITEFRIELLNIYDTADLRRRTSIIEVTWPYTLFKNKTIWYQQDSLHWKKVHQVVWSKGAKF